MALAPASATSRPGERSEPGEARKPSQALSVLPKRTATNLPTSPATITPPTTTSPHPHIEGFTPSDLAERNRIKDRSMRYLRSFSPRAAAKGCMVDPIAATVKIRVDADTGRAHVSGVKRCASPWACPVCSFKVRHTRADELTRLVERVQLTGGTALLITATVPHTSSEALSAVLGDVQGSWRAMWSGSWATSFKRRWGIVGSVRAVELTWGASSGWHPHIHSVMILDRPNLDGTEMVEFWGALMYRWAEVVAGTTGRVVNIGRALDVRPVDDPRNVSEYVTDVAAWSIGAEVTSGPVKLGRSSGRWAPFSLLAAAACWGDADAGRLWSEYEQATAGKRAIVASRGLMARYGITSTTDEEAAEGPEVDQLLVEVELDPMWWAALAALDRQRQYVAAVEHWAAEGAKGEPPDPIEVLNRDARLHAAERRD